MIPIALAVMFAPAIDFTVFEDVTVAVFLGILAFFVFVYFKVIRPLAKRVHVIDQQGAYNEAFAKALRAICKSIITSPDMNNDGEVEEAWNALSNLIIKQANQMKE